MPSVLCERAISEALATGRATHGGVPKIGAVLDAGFSTESEAARFAAQAIREALFPTSVAKQAP